MSRPIGKLVVAVAVGLVVGGCGGGGGGGGGSSRAAADITTVSTGRAQPSTTEANVTGDIPDNQVFVAFAHPTGGFAVKVPEGWARSETSGAMVFSDKLNSIRMETKPAAAAPSVESAQSLEVPTISSAASGFQLGKVTSVKRKAGPAVLITYQADAAPDPVTGKIVRDDVERYEFWQPATEVILTLSGPKGSDNVDPWRIVTDSFAFA